MGSEFSESRKFSRVCLAVAAVWLLLMAAPANLCAQEPDEDTILVSGAMYVNPSGNARVRITYTFQPPRAYDRLRREYPNLYVLFRDFGVNRSNYEINRSSLQIEADDSARSITFKGDVQSVATCRNGRWELALSRKERIVTRVQNRIYTSLAQKGRGAYLINGKFEYALPVSAQIVEYSPDTQRLAYSLMPKKVAGTPKVDFVLRTKKRIMSAAYKIYGDPEAADGAYWIAKTVVKNIGDVPIYDLRLTYRIGEYTEESVAQKYTLVAPKGTVVDIYYPIISSRVSQLRTRTPVELRVRYEYRDARGRVYTDQLVERLELLGINQFEHSNLSDQDRTDSWYDDFNNARLLAGMVMKNDEAVRQFAGAVSEAAGGVQASRSRQEALRWLQAAYDQQWKNNIVYQATSAFMTNDRTLVQDIRYARDVFRDRAGTCIDLAITYASLAEATGLDSYLFLMPGHCFAVIKLPDGDMLPVENTGLRGGDKPGRAEDRLDFTQAVEAGRKNIAEARQKGLFFLVDVGRELSEGRVSSPELPSLPPDFLEKVGIRRRR